ncbi:hypothetical protein DXA36_20160 [Eisenbergiella sp. OF01-20]|nr:hypothetical protein DXA36_20160 [Eisenbergiella sp. OF01-20]
MGSASPVPYGICQDDVCWKGTREEKTAQRKENNREGTEQEEEEGRSIVVYASFFMSGKKRVPLPALTVTEKEQRMKKKEWSKKDRKLLAGIVLLVVFIAVLVTGLAVSQMQEGRGDMQAEMAEALEAGGIPWLSGDDGRIPAIANIACEVLGKLPDGTAGEESVSALREAFLQSGVLAEKEAGELAEWTVDFYSAHKESALSPSDQGDGSGMVVQNTWTKEMKQDLTAISEYLTQMDQSITENKEEILHLTTVQDGGYASLEEHVADLQLTINGLKEQFTAYENQFDCTQNSNTEVYGEIQMQLESIQDEMDTVQTELTERIHTADTNSADRYESIKNTVDKLETSVREKLVAVNQDITKLLEELRKTGEQENKDLLINLEESQEELLLVLDTLHSAFASALKEAFETLEAQLAETDTGVNQLLSNLEKAHTDISHTQEEIAGVLQDMDELDTSRMEEILARFTGIQTNLSEIQSVMNRSHEEIKEMIEALQSSENEKQQELLATLTRMDTSFSETSTGNLDQLILTLQTQTEGIQKWFADLSSHVDQNFQSLTNTVTNIGENVASNKEEMVSRFENHFSDLSTSVSNVNQAVEGNQGELLNRIAELENHTSAGFSQLEQDVQSVFQRASDGKQLLASALLAKNVPITKDATFHEFYEAILRVEQQLVIGVEQVPGTISYDYHYHTGDSEKGSGCYTKKRYHQHGPACYSKATCTVTVHGNGGFWSEGDTWCSCHGNVHKIKQNVIRKHSSCGADDNYGQISFTEHHGPGIDGFHGYDSSTHTYDRLSCGKTNATFVGWDVGCGFVDGQIIGAHILYDPEVYVAPVTQVAVNAYIPKRYEDYVAIPNDEGSNREEEERESEIGEEMGTETVPEETVAETETQDREEQGESKEQEETGGTETESSSAAEPPSEEMESLSANEEPAEEKEQEESEAGDTSESYREE